MYLIKLMRLRSKRMTNNKCRVQRKIFFGSMLIYNLEIMAEVIVNRASPSNQFSNK